MKIESPLEFSSIIHNADCMIWASPKNKTTNLPVEMSSFVNWAVSSSDPLVIEAVESLYNQGSEVNFTHLQDIKDKWVPSSDALNFIQGCTQSADQNVKESAETLISVIFEKKHGCVY